MKPRRKFLTGYAIGAMILPSVCTVILSVGSISISETFQLGLDRVGLLFWALNGGLFSAYLVGGGLCDRFGERPMLFGGTIICAAGALLCQSADALLELSIGVFALGVGGGILWLAAIVLLNHLHRERRRLAMGGSQMAISVACVIGPPAIAYLIRWQDWRVPYALLSAYMIGMTIPLFLLRFPTSVSRKSGGSRLIDIGLFRERRYGLLNLCALLHTGAEVGISTWVCLYVSRKYGIPDVSASLGLMVYALGMAFGRGVVSKLPERYSDVQVLKICAAGSGLFVLLLFLKVNYVGALAFLVLIGFFIGGDWPVLLMYAGKHFPNRSGVVIGHLSLSASVGGFAFLPLMGLVSEHTGIGAMMGVPLMLLLALFLTVSGLGRVDLAPSKT